MGYQPITRRTATVTMLGATLSLLAAACASATPSATLTVDQPTSTTSIPTTVARPAGLAPLVTDPPESVRAESPSDATYSVYQGIVCGVVPRPEYGYTVRYPKIWEAREQGATTWLVDLGNDGLVSETIGEPTDVVQADREPTLIGAVTVAAMGASTEGSLHQHLADGWRARGLADLQLTPVAGALVGGQPGVQWNLAYTAGDGVPMAGYASATVVDGRLFRVEIAMPADRYARREKASGIVAGQLIISAKPDGA